MMGMILGRFGGGERVRKAFRDAQAGSKIAGRIFVVMAAMMMSL
jgi:hypothetical protein